MAKNLLSSLTRPVNTALATTDVTPSSDWWSREACVSEYFDPEGRTGWCVFYAKRLTVQTLGYQEDGGGNPQIPYVNIFINNPPLIWAAYYHIVRTNDLSKLKFIQWITDRSFKDNIASADGNFYAYVSIESLNQYITDNPSSTFLAYAFAPGDRVRFIKLFPKGVTTPPVLYNGIGGNQPVKDYEIQGTVTRTRVINGQQQGRVCEK